MALWVSCSLSFNDRVRSALFTSRTDFPNSFLQTPSGIKKGFDFSHASSLAIKDVLAKLDCKPFGEGTMCSFVCIVPRPWGILIQAFSHYCNLSKPFRFCTSNYPIFPRLCPQGHLSLLWLCTRVTDWNIINDAQEA